MCSRTFVHLYVLNENKGYQSKLKLSTKTLLFCCCCWAFVRCDFTLSLSLSRSLQICYRPLLWFGWVWVANRTVHFAYVPLYPCRPPTEHSHCTLPWNLNIDIFMFSVAFIFFFNVFIRFVWFVLFVCLNFSSAKLSKHALDVGFISRTLCFTV